MTESGERRRCDLCGADRSEDLLRKSGALYVRCRDCGLIFSAQPDPTSEEINEDYFRRHLDKYSARHYAAKKQAIFSRRLRDLSRYRRLNRLLEVGANVGGFVHRAKAEGWNAFGVEPVRACVDHARERHGVELIPALLEEAELPAASFDVVYSNAVFEHLPSPAVVLNAIARVLRPGGVVFIDTVNWDSYTRRILGERWRLVDPTQHLVLFTPRTLSAYCEKAGLDVLRVRTHGVRFREQERPLPRGVARLLDELRKAPLSAACRWTKKGDSIDVLARKPGGGPR